MLAELEKRSALVRRAKRILNQIPKAVNRIAASEDDYRTHRIVVANSVPKSGTHLLSQVVSGFPVRNYGTFVTSIPSVPHRELPAQRVTAALSRLAPGELVLAHIFFDERYAEILERRGACHYFIFRDPRDIVVSEAHYLTNINRWHSVSRSYRALASEAERIELAIRGLPPEAREFDYASIDERYRKYLGWIDHPSSYAVRFEDLATATGSGGEDPIEAMTRHYLRGSDGDASVDRLADAAREAVDPRKSFTFRKGRSGAWEQAFTPQHKELFKRIAGDLLIELGYEKDDRW